LDENGLAKVGTHIRPGMIVVGKIAKTKRFDPADQPTSLKVQGTDFQSLNREYGSMWKDVSLYATTEMFGTVQQAYLEESPSGTIAIVELEPDAALADQLKNRASLIPG
jgi:DNA-directed RNA polymerase beta subunit